MKNSKPYAGLGLSALGFFLLLLPAIPILELEDPRRATMTLFYLSIVLTLLLSYMFSAAGRAPHLALAPGGEGTAGALQRWGFPILHRHAWGDFGRLYALLFLTFMGPILFSLFITLMASAFVGFEGTVEIVEDGAEGLTEGEALNQIASGEIALSAADEARRARVQLVSQISLAVGFILIMPCFARLVPFYFWRSGGRDAATLADTWRRVSWGTAILFGLSLLAGLAALFILPTPLWVRFLLASLLFALWALLLARQVGAYDRS